MADMYDIDEDYDTCYTPTPWQIGVAAYFAVTGFLGHAALLVYMIWG